MLKYLNETSNTSIYDKAVSISYPFNCSWYIGYQALVVKKQTFFKTMFNLCFLQYLHFLFEQAQIPSDVLTH